MEFVPDYKCHLRISEKVPPTEQMTALLFAVDFVKERTGVLKMTNPETHLFYDSDNPTTPEEILKTKMDELLIKRKGETNPFLDNLDNTLSEEDTIYLNDKSQLIRIVKKMSDTGKEKSIHNILSFDINKVP